VTTPDGALLLDELVLTPELECVLKFLEAEPIS
jgi:hypothetical protein